MARRRRLPRPRSQVLLAKRYAAQIRALVVARAQAEIRRVILPVAKALLLREDAVNKSVMATAMRRLRDGIPALFTRKEVESIAAGAMASTNRQEVDTTRRAFAVGLGIERSKVTKELSIIEVDPFGTEPWLNKAIKDAVAENVRLIEDLPRDLYDRLEDDVIRWGKSGVRPEALESLVQSEYLGRAGDNAIGVVSRRAEFLARDQVGKFHSSLDRRRQVAAGVKFYRWRTSEDERVRPLCRSLANKIFSWDDPPEGGHPGEKPLCRCYAEPVLDEVEDELADAKDEAA